MLKIDFEAIDKKIAEAHRELEKETLLARYTKLVKEFTAVYEKTGLIGINKNSVHINDAEFLSLNLDFETVDHTEKTKKLVANVNGIEIFTIVQSEEVKE